MTSDHHMSTHTSYVFEYTSGSEYSVGQMSTFVRPKQTDSSIIYYNSNAKCDCTPAREECLLYIAILFAVHSNIVCTFMCVVLITLHLHVFFIAVSSHRDIVMQNSRSAGPTSSGCPVAVARLQSNMYDTTSTTMYVVCSMYYSTVV